MNKSTLYNLLRAAAERVMCDEDDIQFFEETIVPDKLLTSYGLDIAVFGEIIRDLEIRMNVPSLDMENFLIPEKFNALSIGDLLEHLFIKSKPQLHKEPIVVYVDDEEQNVFIFKRKFSKDFKLFTFTNPFEALEFIKKTPEVALVITDEVMPHLRGNELCTEIKKIIPSMSFILITGNPENDNKLMYRSLQGNRFYDFFQKPVDFDNQREEYLLLINKLIKKDFS